MSVGDIGRNVWETAFPRTKFPAIATFIFDNTHVV